MNPPIMIARIMRIMMAGPEPPVERPGSFKAGCEMMIVQS